MSNQALARKPGAHKPGGGFRDATAVARSLQPSYPVICVRPEVLKKTARHFVEHFPGTVLYAIKCNPHRMVLDALYAAGIRHFDTASLTEIAQICETYPDAQAYFMHPVKGRAVIRSAYAVYGVRYFSVDHESELRKLLDETGGEGVVAVVRLKTPPMEGTLYHLASKFGADLEQAAELMREAERNGCRTGVAFHVGSQCRSPKAYSQALGLVGELLDNARVEPVCVDVGGGFPASYLNMEVPPINDFIEEIKAGLKAISLKPGIEVFAEPGRALVASGCSVLTQVQLRKGDQLYINDGIYGSLSETVQGSIILPTRLIRPNGGVAAQRQTYTIYGPTCDSLDVLPGVFELPVDVREGDWIEVDQLGAYSNALATNFNGFRAETFVEVYDHPPAEGA